MHIDARTRRRHAAVQQHPSRAATMNRLTRLLAVSLALPLSAALTSDAAAQATQKPPLHGRHWMAITGKPLAATAGAMMFQKGGNAVDAAAAMLAATSTMWDVLSWGGETQALIYNPQTGKVIGINALGVAPTGATAAFFREQGMQYPPEHGPLAATTPGTPGGLMVMLAEYGRLSLADVLGPSIEMADGYPIEAQTANSIERNKRRLNEWTYSRAVMLPHLGAEREAPRPARSSASRTSPRRCASWWRPSGRRWTAAPAAKQAIMAAYERFYGGDIAQEMVRGIQEEGGLITMEDLAGWSVGIEEPVATSYKGIDVYKLTVWTQGPALLQALNILEDMDLQAMGYNSARYIHTLYQAMNLAFADRDFYYGDPRVGPEEPVRGLLSKEYARQRAAGINPDRNDADARPGDPYPFQGGTNPFREYLDAWRTTGSWGANAEARTSSPTQDEAFYAGTTTVQAADAEGWVVSITPSGGWIPAVIAGRTGIGLSQRMQSFVLDPAENPFNVVQPGQQPRVTLTPTLALKDGVPFLSFAVQGGDSQDQNLLQFFLNMVEFDMTVQEATEAANINSFQMRGSFGNHESQPGRLLVHNAVPPWVQASLRRMGLHADLQRPHVGTHQCHLLRPRAWHDVGRVEQPWRGLWDCVVNGTRGRERECKRKDNCGSGSVNVNGRGRTRREHGLAPAPAPARAPRAVPPP
jgi:gamma-glutamyltranspeptidase / glutathione hydrolase